MVVLDKVNRSPDQSLQLVLDTGQGDKRHIGRSRETDENIDITDTGRTPRDGPEQCQ